MMIGWFLMFKNNELLKNTVNSWSYVQKENESHKDYVTVSQWNTWESYNNRVCNQLKVIIDEYDGKKLSETAERDLLGILKSIAEADHKSAQELSEGDNMADEDDFEKLEQEENEFNNDLMNQKFKESLKSKLGFKKDFKHSLKNKLGI